MSPFWLAIFCIFCPKLVISKLRTNKHFSLNKTDVHFRCNNEVFNFGSIKEMFLIFVIISKNGLEKLKRLLAKNHKISISTCRI